MLCMDSPAHHETHSKAVAYHIPVLILMQPALRATHGPTQLHLQEDKGYATYKCDGKVKAAYVRWAAKYKLLLFFVRMALPVAASRAAAPAVTHQGHPSFPCMVALTLACAAPICAAATGVA